MNKQTLEGLDEMVAMSFNAAQFQPRYGGGGGLPPGKYKGVIVDTRQENVEKNNMVVGGYLAIELTPIEGPLVGTKHTDRLNLHHTNPKTVEIANSQLSAYCAVTGKRAFQDTSELHNLPFLFEIGFQKGEEPSEAKPNGGYTEVKAILDLNGNTPDKAGAGPQQQAQVQQQAPIPQQPAGGVVPQGQGWGGAPQEQQQAPQQQYAPQQQQQPAPGVDNNVPMPQQGQPQQGAGGWGQQGQGAPQQQQQAPVQQQQAPAQQGQGWAQQAPQQGAQQQPAAWGQRA